MNTSPFQILNMTLTTESFPFRSQMCLIPLFWVYFAREFMRKTVILSITLLKKSAFWKAVFRRSCPFREFMYFVRHPSCCVLPADEVNDSANIRASCLKTPNTRVFLLFPAQDLNCFLVDNNGFILLSKDRSEVRSSSLSVWKNRWSSTPMCW